ncbi:hypothetical protein [Pedobacter sp. UYP1]|uniref:hypothetical protein n=1 Tax=Pedobacter sp. UYP1 TaxID=1756396 RepID=UPI003397A228
MKKFFKQLLFFVFPVLLFGFVADILLKRIPNDYSYKSTYLDEHAKDIKVLFLGNSHVYYGINPVYIKEVSFNAAHISQPLDYDLEILEKYNKSLTRLKFIVIPIDYFSLYTTLGTGAEKWRVKNYSIYYNINPDHDLLNDSEPINMKLSVNFSRLKNHYLEKKSEITCSELGWGFTYNSKYKKDLEETGKVSAARHTITVKDSLIYYKNKGVINRIIEIAKTKSVPVVFITCPAYKSYTSRLNQSQLKNTVHTISEFLRENPGTKYFDLLNDRSFIAGDFFDADHLNEIGAKKLSLKIDNLLK